MNKKINLKLRYSHKIFQLSILEGSTLEASIPCIRFAEIVFNKKFQLIILLKNDSDVIINLEQ